MSLTTNQMLTDPRLGYSKLHDISRIHETFTELHDLHEFCATHGFSYGLHDDGSIYISEVTPDDKRWWGRLFSNGIVETYFYTKDRQHLNPELKHILNAIKSRHPEFYKEIQDV